MGCAVATPAGSDASAGAAWAGLGGDGLRRRRPRCRDGVEYAGQPLLELAAIGGDGEAAAGRLGEAAQWLEVVDLVGEADHVDAERRRFLLQRGGGRADIGVAAVAAIGDQDDVEAALRRCGLGGVAYRRGDGGLTFRLDLIEQLALRCKRKLAGLGQHFAVGAIRGLAMAEGNQPER